MLRRQSAARGNKHRPATASGGHHKLHVHANRCARVPFQGKASDSSYDATAAGALPAEHLWNAPAVFSGKCGMAAGSHKHARDAQLVPRGGPPERLPRLVSRSQRVSSSAVAAAAPAGAAAWERRRASRGSCFLQETSCFDKKRVPRPSLRLRYIQYKSAGPQAYTRYSV